MKRSGFRLIAFNEEAAKAFFVTESHSIQSVMENAARCGQINTANEPVLIRVEPFTSGDDDQCDFCHLSVDLCNCQMIEPDPHPHIRLIRAN